MEGALLDTDLTEWYDSDSLMGLQERQAIAEGVALRLFPKTYGDLARLANDEGRADAFLTEQGVEIRRTPHVTLRVGKAGHLRKKICVEITVVDSPMDFQERPGCVYFEKHSSGKLVVYGFRQ